MADRIQFRRDTAARWAEYNPILLEGEIGFITDSSPIQYKMGDGVNNWNNLELAGFNGNIVDSTGTSESAVMSQKAVTEAIEEVENDVSNRLLHTSPISGYFYASDGSVLNINTVDYKVEFSGGRIFFLYNRPAYGSTDTQQLDAFETDFVYNNITALSNVWQLLYNVVEKKIYAYHYGQTNDIKEYVNGTLTWLYMGSFSIYNSQFFSNIQFPLSVNGIQYSPQAPLYPRLGYNYALINSSHNNYANVIYVDTVENKLKIQGGFYISCPTLSNNSFRAINSDSANTDLIKSDSFSGLTNVVVIYNLEDSKVYGYCIAESANSLPADKNTYFLIGVIYCNVGESSYNTGFRNVNYAEGVNARALGVNLIKHSDTQYGIFDGLKIGFLNEPPSYESGYLYFASTRFFIYNKAHSFGIHFYFGSSYTSENSTYYNRYFSLEQTRVYLPDYVVAGSYLESVLKTVYIRIRPSSSMEDDYTKLPIVVYCYSSSLDILYPEDSAYLYIPLGYIWESIFYLGDSTFGNLPVPRTSLKTIIGYSDYLHDIENKEGIISISAPDGTVNSLIIKFRLNVDTSYPLWVYDENGRYISQNNITNHENKALWADGVSVSFSQLWYVIFDSNLKQFFIVHYGYLTTFYVEHIARNLYIMGYGSLNSGNFVALGNITIFGKRYSSTSVYPNDAYEYMSDVFEVEYTDNLFDKEAVYKGYKNTSTWSVSETFSTSDFIAVTPGESYVIYQSAGSQTNCWVYAYDADFNPVQLIEDYASDTTNYGANGTAWKNVYWNANLQGKPMIDGVYYIRAIFYNTQLDTAMVGKASADFSTYVPYRRVNIKTSALPESYTDSATRTVCDAYGLSQVGAIEYAEPYDYDYAQIILYGQSLSMGWECPDAITTEAVEGNYMVGNCPINNTAVNGYASELNPLIATTWASGGEQPIVGAVNSFSRMYRRFRNKDQKFIGSSVGVGGQSIEKFSKNCTNTTAGTTDSNYYNSYFLKLLERTKAAVDTEGATVGCVAILWMQGEHNYTGSSLGISSGTEATKDKDEYKAYLKQLKEDMQADIMSYYGQTVKPLFFTYQTAGGYINRKDMSINMAQIEFAQENDDVFLLPSTYPVPDYSGGHLSTNGYRWYGEMMAKCLYSVFCRGEQFLTVFPEKFEVSGNVLRITFYVPVPPLVIDTWTKESITNYGFVVYNDESTVTINSIEIEGSNVVKITCASELDGEVEVTYAGQSRSGSGNLRDSDKYYSMYTYYDDSESQQSKAENYTPEDEDGNTIYGKRYPMFNWCANFYYKIS